MFGPEDFRTAESRKKVRKLTRKQYSLLPHIQYNIIEDVANRRLRVDSELKAGAMTITEGRVDFGRPEYYDPEDLYPELRKQIAEAENVKKQTDLAEREVDIAEKSADAQTKSADAQTMAAKNRPTSTSSTSKN